MVDELHPVSVAYDTRLEDYLALYRLAVAKRHPRYRQATWLLLVLVGVAVVASIVLDALPALIAAVVATLLLVLRLWTPERFARRRWQREGSARFEARLDATGYTVSSAGRTTAIEWRAVEVLSLWSDHLYLSAGDVDAVIALRGLPPGWTPGALYEACVQWRAAAVSSRQG